MLTYELWDSRDAKRIITHKQLRPIMENLGFIMILGKKTTAFEGFKLRWVEYKYNHPFIKKPNRTPPIPRLPYTTHIDGFHIYTYVAFFQAIHYYRDILLNPVLHVLASLALLYHSDIPNWSQAEGCSEKIIRRRGTFDPSLLRIYDNDYHNLRLISRMEDSIVLVSDIVSTIPLVYTNGKPKFGKRIDHVFEFKSGLRRFPPLFSGNPQKITDFEDNNVKKRSKY